MLNALQKSKRTPTRLLLALGNQNGFFKALKGFYTLCGSQNGLIDELQKSNRTSETVSLKLYKGAIRFREVKRLSEAQRSANIKKSFYFVEVWTDSLKLYMQIHALWKSKRILRSSTRRTRTPYKAATRLAKVNTESPKLYRAATRFTEVNTRLLHALRKSKLTHKLNQDSTHCAGQNGLSERLQACNTICRCKKEICEAPQDTLCESQNGLCEMRLLQALWNNGNSEVIYWRQNRLSEPLQGCYALCGS